MLIYIKPIIQLSILYNIKSIALLPEYFLLNVYYYIKQTTYISFSQFLFFKFRIIYEKCIKLLSNLYFKNFRYTNLYNRFINYYNSGNALLHLNLTNEF